MRKYCVDGVPTTMHIGGREKETGRKSVNGQEPRNPTVQTYMSFALKMVEFKDDTPSDAKSDAMAITGGFRAASDDDVRTVMNAMSNPTQEILDSLRFYIVPKSWFMKAWPLLTARSHDNVKDGWRQQIGRIENAELVDVEHEISSSDDEKDAEEQQKKRFEKMHLRFAKNGEQASMTKGLHHQTDFFFLGPSAWMLVKEKFGYDGYELARSLISGNNNTLSIQLRAQECEGDTARLIEIPPSGRFPYEKIMVNAAIMSDQLPLVPDEEKGSSEMVFPGVARANPQGEANTEESPILLLPPSTSTTTPDNNYASSVQDMEIESEKASVDDMPMSGRKRLASGLGNLGNTCFMNSTIQCLAHTEPLRKYFLSGEYEAHINRDNVLGTGGELATQFTSLIREMWGLPSKRRNVLGTEGSSSSYSTSAVYPRNFKHCVGKHAEQFMGYDQHDSHEFATYLLDALHEDTNRITKKPYTDKPEQGEDEPDDVAADKAWALYLQRDNSRVFEIFMGQVKSRLECNEESCDRVSTTFDPFMYLSVPIPGASDRSIKVTYIPLDPQKRPLNLSLTVNKTANVGKLLAKLNEELIKAGVRDDNVALHDLVGVDVWNHEIFAWFKSDDFVDRIRNTDNTFIYELTPLAEIEEACKSEEEKDETETKLTESKTEGRYKLDIGSVTRLNKDDEWQTELEKYVSNQHSIYSMFNPRRGTIDERMQFHRKLDNFISACYNEIGEEETSGLKRTRADSDADKDGELAVSVMEEIIQGLVERSDLSKSFKEVKSKQDIAILEFISKKMRQFILNLVNEKKNQYKDGVVIQVQVKRSQNGQGSSSGTNFASPLAIRVPQNMSVYGLRKELASRLSRALQSEEKRRSQNADPGESTAENADKENGENVELNQPFGSPELMIMRQVPLTFDRKAAYGGRSYSNKKQLGMLETDSIRSIQPQQATLADPNNEEEKALVADVVGPKGTVVLEWPLKLSDSAFDLDEYEKVDDSQMTEEPPVKKEAVTTVLDCIKNYCQMEQLEETEMWHCNKCKKHVRAWKQFHLYRAPPILIIHLKRFYFSATTHRRDKISTFIDFPLEGLDLTEMVSHFSEEEKPIYDLYGVSNHYGGLGGGHYTAHILNDDGQWCYYDDSRVTTQVDAKEVVSEAAYVLYYRRKDVPFGQDIVEQTVSVSPSHMIFEPVEDSKPASDIASDEGIAVVHDGDMAMDDSIPLGSVEVELNADMNVPDIDINEVRVYSGVDPEPVDEEDFPLQ